MSAYKGTDIAGAAEEEGADVLQDNREELSARCTSYLLRVGDECLTV